MDLGTIFNVASFVVGAAGFLVGAYGLRRMKTAQRAEKAVRRKMLNQMASEDFEEIARNAATLVSMVRTQDWNRGIDVATLLTSSLSRASGSWSTLLEGTEKDKLQVSIGEIMIITSSILMNPEQVPPNTIQELITRCYFIIEVGSEIAGRLKFVEEPETK